MGKGGKYAARRKHPAKGFLYFAVFLGFLIAGFLFLNRNSREIPLPVTEKKTPYGITSTLMEFDVQWAQATIWKGEGVHLHLTQKQIGEVIHALNRLDKSAFEQVPVDNSVSVMLHFSDKEILLQYDGERVGFVFDSATAEEIDSGSWSVSDLFLKSILDPIADLDNTRQWVGYMTSYDLKNLCLQTDNITWEYFEDFAYWSIGEGEIRIPIEDSHHILVTGSRNGKPDTLYLVENSNLQNRMNIRTSDVDTLLAVFHNPVDQDVREDTSFLSQEQAMQNGFVVMQDGDVRYNQDSWQNFIELTEAGVPAAVTVMHYTRETAGTTCIRYGVVFEDGIYTLKIEAEQQQLSCSFSGLEKTEGKLDPQKDGCDRYIRYTLTGGSDTADVVIVEDLIASPDLSGADTIALHMKVVEPPLEVYGDPQEVEGILGLLRKGEYQMVPPDDYVLGVTLILYVKDEQRAALEVDILQGVFRYGNNYYRYGELPDLFQVLGITQWPEEVRNEYYGYLYYS